MKWRFEWRGTPFVEDRAGDCLAVLDVRTLTLITVFPPGQEPSEMERRMCGLVKVRKETEMCAGLAGFPDFEEG